MTTNRVATILAVALFSAVLTPVAMLAQEAPVIADAYISSANSTVNFGAMPNLNLASNSPVLLQFSMAGLPSGVSASEIVKATLRIYVNRIGVQGQMDVSLITAPWVESTVTAAAMPSMTSAGLPPVPLSQAGQWVAVDVTSTLREWFNSPGSNYGLALTTTTAPATVAFFDSKENTATSHPAEIDLVVNEPSMKMALCTLYTRTGQIVPANLACPNCGDGMKNGSETDIDCGGSCPACATGKVCAAHTDCVSANCSNGVCAPPACGGWPNVMCGGACIDVSADPHNCGGCGNLCATNLTCYKGVCALLCIPPGTQCGGLACVNPQTDMENCGSCGHACPAVPNATRACLYGVCGVGSCNVGFGNCDAIAANGCEANLQNDARNCGGCGIACGGSTPYCINGACHQ